jgi:hypothetical protein
LLTLVTVDTDWLVVVLLPLMMMAMLVLLMLPLRTMVVVLLLGCLQMAAAVACTRNRVT